MQVRLRKQPPYCSPNFHELMEELGLRELNVCVKSIARRSKMKRDSSKPMRGNDIGSGRFTDLLCQHQVPRNLGGAMPSKRSGMGKAA